MSKLAVVTGGTKGIGRAIIEKLAAHEFNIATCSRNSSELDSLKNKVQTTYGIKVYGMKADLSVRSQSEAFTEFVLATGEPVEILVNNAGVFVPGKIIDEEEGVLENLLRANLFSAYHVTRGLTASMMKQKRGHIFNMCSVASIMAYPNGGSYSISKFALLGFSKSLREELKGHHVRVTAVLPGATLTDSWMGSNLPETRFIKPSDVADAVYGAYAMSDRSVVEEIIIRPIEGDI